MTDYDWISVGGLCLFLLLGLIGVIGMSLTCRPRQGVHRCEKAIRDSCLMVEAAESALEKVPTGRS